MDKKKYWIIRLFFVLFTMSVSVATLPCGIINVHSLFGEITTYICLTTVSTKRLFQKNCGIRCIKRQVTGAKNKLANQMDNLSVSDEYYDKKYEDMQVRLDKLYEAEQEEGRNLRSLKFRFPVFFNEQELYELDWDNESTVESVLLMRRAKR